MRDTFSVISVFNMPLFGFNVLFGLVFCGPFFPKDKLELELFRQCAFVGTIIMIMRNIYIN